MFSSQGLDRRIDTLLCSFKYNLGPFGKEVHTEGSNEAVDPGGPFVQNILTLVYCLVLHT